MQRREKSATGSLIMMVGDFCIILPVVRRSRVYRCVFVCLTDCSFASLTMPFAIAV